MDVKRWQPLPMVRHRVTLGGLAAASLARRHRRRLPTLARLLLVIALLAAPGCSAVRGPPPPAPERAEVNRPHELRFDVPLSSRASRDEVVIRAEVTAPSGATFTAGGFALERGFAVRVRPREVGVHTYRVLADAGDGFREVARGALDAEGRGAEGQVIVRGAALETEQGRPFRPLGENRFNVYDPEWSDGMTPDAYVARMAADGMNTLRVFVFSACGRDGAPVKPGCLEPALGRFDPHAAEGYDAIFAAAERHGVKVVLSIFAIGFTSGDLWKGWEENPYSVDRGGPADAPGDFFATSRAREAARKRLRYVLARWSASPALLAVDLLNEPEWDGGIDERLWIPWAEDLARTWRDEDPYAHPITLGPVGLHLDVVRDERPWWESPLCDVVQWHRYGPDIYDVHALAAELVATARDTRRYGKPVLIGEFAYGGEAKPLYDHTHVGIWAATFAGAGVLAHSAPQFTVDSDEPMTPERGRKFRVLSDFLRRAEAQGALAPAEDPATNKRGLRALALSGERAHAVWVHAPRHRYRYVIRNAEVTLRGVAAGRWRVTWMDDSTGEAVTTEEHDLGGDAVLRVPPFVKHLAGIVERVG